MTKAYSFQDVGASLSGPTGVVNLGYGAQVSDEGISIDMAEDKSTMTIGADGSGMHSLHASKAGHVTVRLLKTSPINALLMAMYDAQTITASLHGQNTIVITQTASGDITSCRRCAFKKRPNLNYKKDGDIVEWPFDAISIDSVLGTY